MTDRAWLRAVCGSPYAVPRTRQSERNATVPATTPVSGGTYGERIAAALARAGRTKSWLAKEIGVGWQTVHAWTTGKHQPDGNNIEAAAKALEMTPAELLGVLRGQEPPFEAWAAFLETPDAQSMTEDHRIALAAIPWPPGSQPTVASYQVALTALRTTVPRPST